MAKKDGAEQKVLECETSQRIGYYFSLGYPSLLYLLVNTDNPVAVWRKLEEQFQKKSWVNRLSLRCKLHSLRLKDGEVVKNTDGNIQ